MNEREILARHHVEIGKIVSVLGHLIDVMLHHELDHPLDAKKSLQIARSKLLELIKEENGIGK